MANNRKPPAQKRLEGTYRADRDKTVMSPGEPLGEPPAYLTPEQLTAWDELLTMIPEGILFRSDRLIIEQTARLMAVQRIEGLCIGETKLLIQCMGKLGLSPLDRPRIPAAAPKPDQAENKFAKYK